MNKLVSRFRNGSQTHCNAKSLQASNNEKRIDFRSVITADLLVKSERFTQASAHVCKIDDKTVVKTGDGVHMTEAITMRYVREKTSIPVPRVYDAFVREDTGHTCIVMEHVDGETLDKCWPSMSDHEKSCIISQLRAYLNELRSIAHDNRIGSVNGGHCEDQFFDQNPAGYGPFDSVKDFHNGLAQALRAKAANSWTEMVIKFIQSLPDNSDIVFTHNDIAPRNILIKDAKVAAIIDWEMAGFYPEHWEYIKALFWPDWQSPWITEGVVDKILRPYTTELACLLHAREIIW